MTSRAPMANVVAVDGRLHPQVPASLKIVTPGEFRQKQLELVPRLPPKPAKKSRK